MSKRYNYFYRITNTIDGKYYYGVHSTDDLDDGYMGSGVVLKKAIKKYGIENFVKDILVYFDSVDEMYEYERSIVDMNKVRDQQCYNVALGGEGGDLGEEVRKKQSESLKGKPAWNKGIPRTEDEKQKISESLKGRSSPMKGKPGTFRGKCHSEETKKKISETLNGRSSPMKGKHHSEDARKKISESMKGHPGFNKGNPRSEETKKKISEAMKGKNKGRRWRLDPTTNKRIYY